MTTPPSPDVWAPPELSATAPPATGGPELAYFLERPAFRREVRAWIRATRWWAHPGVAAVAIGVSSLVVFVGLVAIAVGLATPLLSMAGVPFIVMPVVLTIRPFGMARAMTSRLDKHSENVLRIDGGRLVLHNVRELSVPLARLTEVRERPEMFWLMFGKRLVVFVPKRPRRGDVQAFLAELREHRDDPTTPEPVGPALAQAAFRPPSRVVHIARTYATSLRSPLFLLNVVLIILCFTGAVAAMPWQVSRDLVVPLALMGCGMILVLLAPALNIAMSGRSALGERGTVTVWSAQPHFLRSEGPSGTLDIPWSDVVGVRRIGGFGVLDLSSGRLIFGISDAVSGDPVALFRAIDTHAGASPSE